MIIRLAAVGLCGVATTQSCLVPSLGRARILNVAKLYTPGWQKQADTDSSRVALAVSSSWVCVRPLQKKACEGESRKGLVGRAIGGREPRSTLDLKEIRHCEDCLLLCVTGTVVISVKWLKVHKSSVKKKHEMWTAFNVASKPARKHS